MKTAKVSVAICTYNAHFGTVQLI